MVKFDSQLQRQRRPSHQRTEPNQTKPNQTKPNQTKPNQTKPNQTKPNQTKPYRAGITAHFDQRWHKIAWKIVCLWRYSQIEAPGVAAASQPPWLQQLQAIDPEAFEACASVSNLISSYRHPELQGGRGSPVQPSQGLLWSGFRPSDDKCQYHYLIPSNMFAVVELRHLQTIATEILHDATLTRFAQELEHSGTSNVVHYILQRERERARTLGRLTRTHAMSQQSSRRSTSMLLSSMHSLATCMRTKLTAWAIIC
jgi:hypothetical protein